MANVSTACNTLTSPGAPNYPLTKLNYLVMSPGFMSSAGFNPTTEGIDRKLAVHVYARWKFADKLMPLLEEAAKNGEEARVVTILAAGQGKPIELDNLGLKKRYSLYKSGVTSPTYNTLLAEVSYFNLLDGAFMQFFFWKTVLPIAYCYSLGICKTTSQRRIYAYLPWICQDEYHGQCLVDERP